MRAALGIVSLLLALVIVGVLAKKQVSATRSTVPVLQPAADAPATATVRAQSQQVQQQYQQAIEGLVQQARPLPDDEK
ncbi:hypothetical protein B2J88_41305 [Rhodococcus sp. SRB_17]|uniref:hypothetical protein n=1 Tax=Acidovorax sp. SRB_24 TaxID=1962700 RepID=UPI00145DDDE6|nr:hypothetical protein [Acidovorax sp. SRB_24]NMM77579.1 hypothetical protein [Acidovorax sp. SRB_24]NMM90701.1 hypothetical protein [Rhodococcus sp. SRB_17]